MTVMLRTLLSQLDEDYNDDYNDDDDHDEDEDILDINNGDSAAKYESDVEGNQRERIGLYFAAMSDI